jgi:hypothetical protein
MLFGIHTVLAGQRVAVWNATGEVRLVDGPCRRWLWRETVRPVERHSARDGEYLIITYQDGRVEHRAGPVMVWQHPTEHLSIVCAQAIAISAHEAVVVYGRDGDVVRRRVVRGPAQFVPASGEWLHQFSWHGADPKRPDHKIPRALQFERLRVIPDQMYLQVEAVRTSDDALITVDFMVFFELADIHTMLDQTHDPIADLINALTADTIEFAAARTFEQFKAETDHLNQLDTFVQLLGRAQRIGYRIGKVVYRGYHASQQLQAMHDHAIEARTSLRLEAETEEQAQTLADLKLTRERDRTQVRQAMEQESAAHAARLAQAEAEAQITRDRLASDARRDIRDADHRLHLRQRQELDQQKQAFATGMAQAGVDVTRWLVARYQHPDRLIRIEGRDDVQLQMTER